MAAPVDAARATTNITTAASPWTVNLPSGITAGDLLVMFLQVANGRDVTVTGWTQQLADANDAADDNHIVLYKVADGSEGATESVVLTGGTGKGTAIVWRVTGAKTTGTILTSAIAANGNSNLDPPNCATDGGASADVLAIAMGGVDGETQTFSAAPSTYANLQTANSGTGSTPATNCVVGAATKGLTAVTAVNPGAFTNTAPTTVNGGTAITVLVHADAAGGSALTKDLADTVTLSDAIVKSPVAIKADTMTLSDAIVKKPALGKADTVILSDAVTKSFGLSKADTVTLSDAMGKSFGKAVADTLTLSEGFSALKILRLLLADTITLSDALTKAAGLGKSDTVTLTDAVGKTVHKPAADTVTLTDAISKKPGKGLSDTVTLSDSIIGKAIAIVKADVITLVEQITLPGGVVPTTVRLTWNQAKSWLHRTTHRRIDP